MGELGRDLPARAVPSAKLRFARWFIDARWSVNATAALFDLAPADLAAALSLQEAA